MSQLHSVVQPHKPYVVVLGNEKGGTGKSTLSMHVIVSFLKSGLSVGSIDLDARQGSLTRYLEHRERYAASEEGQEVPCPRHISLLRSEKTDRQEAETEEKSMFETCWQKLRNLEETKFVASHFC